MPKFILSIFVVCSIWVNAQKPQQWSSAEIYHNIQKLGVLGNVLYLAAHPDDENTRFISYCANEKKLNTAYLSLTRGDGGQNLVGPEIREELGIIRTQELLAARRTDGGIQYFTRANDFGYSKTPEETLEIWDKDKILSDVVWVIRKFRPDIIVCRFPSDGGGGHGHHTASAMLAEEAFDLAADATKYPEQLKYVDVWQPKRLVVNTGRWWNPNISDESEDVVSVNIGGYNAVLGTSYNEIAAQSRTMHKSQGFGSTGTRGNYTEYFEHIKGLKARNDLFDGLTLDWKRVSKASKIEKEIHRILETFSYKHPEKSIEELLELRAKINTVQDIYWQNQKTAQIDEIIKQCLGLYIEAVAESPLKTAEDSLRVSFEIINRSGSDKVKLQSISNPNLSYMEEKDTLLKSNQQHTFEASFQLPNLPISQPYWLKETPDLGAYIVEDQNLIGLPENKPALSFKATFNIYGKYLTYNFPLVYKQNDPVDGEQHEPFVIAPKIVANLSQDVYLFSENKERVFSVTVKALSDSQTAKLEVKLPEGWQAEHDETIQLKKKGDEVTLQIKLTPFENAQNGELELHINGNQAQSLRIIDYNHIPKQTWFPKTQAKLVFVDLHKKNNKIAYFPGAGDIVPELLANIGYEVTILDENSLDNLEQFDAILTGIRFLNVNERAAYIMPKLLSYVKNGGNLIMQYNTAHRLKTDDFAPYKLVLSRARVTEEDAEPTFLASEHEVMNAPNKITKADFQNWVQERGLYFPDEWDENFTPILRWNDKGETPKDGSLLIAPYGKGNYVYTGISFFRELPEGVPGAYKLLVNLISLSPNE